MSSDRATCLPSMRTSKAQYRFSLVQSLQVPFLHAQHAGVKNVAALAAIGEGTVFVRQRAVEEKFAAFLDEPLGMLRMRGQH